MTGLPKSSFQPVHTDTPQFPISHNLKLHKTEPGYDRTMPEGIVSSRTGMQISMK